MTRNTHLATALLVSVMAAATAHAGDFDGSRGLICAPQDVVECDVSADCARRSVSEADVPPFFRVDFKKKQLAAMRGAQRTSPIENTKLLEGATILQGAEFGRAWSIVIDQLTGSFTASIADAFGALAILGACAPD